MLNMSYEELSKNTPAYYFNVGDMKDRVKLIRDYISPRVGLCFAMKANPFIVSSMDGMVEHLEVCSPGEYEICIRNNIDPAKIIVSGVNKTDDSIERIMEYSKGLGTYTIESMVHYRIITDAAKALGKKIDVIIRLSSGNQFGVDKECLEEIIKLIKNDDVLNLIGIHYYSGTQKKIKKISSELSMLNEYGQYLKDTYGLDKLLLEYGPGLIVSYFENDSASDIEKANPVEQLKALSEELNKIDSYDDITIELGRFLTSMCGYYVTKIMDVKKNNDASFVIADGGIHQLGYYGQMMGMKKPYITQLKKNTISGEATKYTICGSLCTVNDVITRDVDLTNPEIGDILLFERCGGYSVTEGMSMFLSRELPYVYLVSDNEVKELRTKIETNIFNSL